MDIKTNVKLNKNIIKDSSNFMNVSTIASGWVEVDGFIKFPVNVRKFIDKEDNKEKMFVSFPQRRNGSGEYTDVVRPESKEVRMEVQSAVINQVQKELMKEFDLPEISDIKVTPLDQEKSMGSIQLKAVASIKISGFVISGITIKESKRGLFVQMPQYNENGQYKDTVYGTSSFVQQAISDAVLREYDVVLQKKEHVKEQEVQTEKIQEETIPDKTVVPPIKITDAYVYEGYLHFTVQTEDEKMKGLFRIYAPKDGKDMELVSIEGWEKYPQLQMFWNSIEEPLQERCANRYSQLKNEDLSQNAETPTVSAEPIPPVTPKGPKL